MNKSFFKREAMPTYDFRCLDCGRRFEAFFTFADYGKKKAVCPQCCSQNVTRKIGRIRIARSEESRMSQLEGMADPNRLESLENDPRELGRMMRTMGSELGESIGPEFDEVVNRLEKGQNPDQIEKDLPDLAAGMDSSDGGGGMGDDDF
jgi:putative FmdB family regulatory protein